MPSNKPSNIFLNSSFYKYANLASFNDSTAIYELKYAKDGTKMKTKIENRKTLAQFARLLNFGKYII